MPAAKYDWAYWGPRVGAAVRVTGRNWERIERDLGLGCPSQQAMRAYLDRHPHLVADSVIGPGQPPVVITRPFEVPLPYLPAPQEAKTIRAILYGDVHFPDQDDKALGILASVTERYQPDVLICMGDLLDSHALSDHDRNPRKSLKYTLQDEVDMARTHLAQMAMIVPPSTRRILLEGNHEDRLRRMVWRAQEKERSAFMLNDVQRALEWENILHLDEIGWEFYPYHGPTQAQQEFLPKFIVKHGNVVRKWSASTAKGEHEKYGKSGASGHVHRGGMFFHRDHNGNHVWLETFCLCRLDPDWTPYPDWQQGFWVIAFDAETGAFGAEPVYVHNGRAVWRDEVYQA
jgi:hypothetical protein